MKRITKKYLKRKLRNTAQTLRETLFPTPTEMHRMWHTENERTDRYEKYIPHYTAQTYFVPASWFLLFWFAYFMIFGISMNNHKQTIDIEPFDTANTEINHIEFEPAEHNPQIVQAWNYVMKPLNLDKDTYLNWLILLQGTIIGLAPTVILAHRKNLVNKMYAEKWKLISPIDKTDIKIIYNMSKDAPNYFYHLTLSLTSAEKMHKYKKIAAPIIHGYIASHPEPEYNKEVMAILKRFADSKTK